VVPAGSDARVFHSGLARYCRYLAFGGLNNGGALFLVNRSSR
jgi:hypothetical protein